LEGFYAFFITFPALFLVSVSFANFVARLNTLERLLPVSGAGSQAPAAVSGFAFRCLGALTRVPPLG
jgi:hypothetical protein